MPISAQLKYNIDAVCEYLVKKIPVPKRDFISPPQVRAAAARRVARRMWLGGGSAWAQPEHMKCLPCL